MAKSKKKKYDPATPVKELFFGGGLRSIDKQRAKKKKYRGK